MKKILLAIILCLMSVQSAFAACVADGSNWASTPDYTSVASCVSQADAGDTITVSAGDGTETWSTELTITKGVNLIGPGASNLTITSGVTPYLIRYTPSDYSQNWPLRISGFTIDLTNNGTGIYLSYSSSDLTIQTKIRLDHLTFPASTSGVGIHINGQRGVADNNTFTNFYYPYRFTSAPYYGYTWWENWEGLVFGKADNNFYIEDNTITSPYGIVGCQEGNRYAFRYNTITSTSEATPLMDSHGDCSINNSSCMYWSCFGGEIYGNNITIAGSVGYGDFRGGKWIVLNNVVDNAAKWAGWGIRDSEGPGTACDCTYCASTNTQPQYISDSYAINNREGGPTGTISNFYSRGFEDCSAACGYSVDENEEYFNQVSSPTVAGNGTVGVGCGTLANRPGTCTTGVGYWATNQSCSNLTDYVGASPTTPISGTLYKCTATNTWTEFYTPYAYPHPLRGESGSGSYMIKIAKSGDGTGTVTEGENINCGENCAYDYYLYDGQEIEFTSTPATGSYVSGWSGCTQQADPTKCKLTVSADATVTASFTNGRKCSLGAGGGTITVGP